MDNKKIISEMTLAREQFNLAKDTGIGLAAAKEKMKNIGFTYFDDLLEAAKKAVALEDEVATLNVALEDSDRELAALKNAAQTGKKKIAE